MSSFCVLSSVVSLVPIMLPKHTSSPWQTVKKTLINEHILIYERNVLNWLRNRCSLQCAFQILCKKCIMVLDYFKRLNIIQASIHDERITNIRKKNCKTLVLGNDLWNHRLFLISILEMHLNFRGNQRKFLWILDCKSKTTEDSNTCWWSLKQNSPRNECSNKRFVFSCIKVDTSCPK